MLLFSHNLITADPAHRSRIMELHFVRVFLPQQSYSACKLSSGSHSPMCSPALLGHRSFSSFTVSVKSSPITYAAPYIAPFLLKKSSLTSLSHKSNNYHPSLSFPLVSCADSSKHQHIQDDFLHETDSSPNSTNTVLSHTHSTQLNLQVHSQMLDSISGQSSDASHLDDDSLDDQEYSDDVTENDDDNTAYNDSWYTVKAPANMQNKAISTVEQLSTSPASPVPSDSPKVLNLATLDSLVRSQAYKKKQYDWNKTIEFDESGGQIIPVSMGFQALIIDQDIWRNIDFLGYKEPTPVQSAAIPFISTCNDIVIQSNTGSGKTMAYLIPLLERIDIDSNNVQVVVIAPTRELAMQIYKVCGSICQDTQIKAAPLIGGANIKRQLEKINKETPHILIGTPGRIREIVSGKKRALSLRNLSAIVVDEADHCLRNIFYEDIQEIFHSAPRSRQSIYVSATGDRPFVKDFALKWGEEVTLVKYKGEARLPTNIDHYYTIVPQHKKLDALRRAVHTEPKPEAVVCFVSDQNRVDLVWEKLLELDIKAVPLRGDADKVERSNVLQAFRRGDFQVLVATEVAARGLDVPSVTLVVNLDLPTDADHYVHRAGRCGRAGIHGITLSVTTPADKFVILKLGRALNQEIKCVELKKNKFLPIRTGAVGVPKNAAVESELAKISKSSPKYNISTPANEDSVGTVHENQTKKKKSVVVNELQKKKKKKMEKEAKRKENKAKTKKVAKIKAKDKITKVKPKKAGNTRKHLSAMSAPERANFENWVGNRNRTES